MMKMPEKYKSGGGSLSRIKGFTLVELLIVIGLIALLIGLLLPALRRARAQAQSVACMSNMRQVGVILLIYANNNHGYLFPDHMGYAAENIGPVFPDDGSPTEYHNVWTVPVLGKWDPPLMLCPSDLEPFEKHSYILNEYMAYYNEKFGRSLPNHVSASDVIIMGEKVSSQPDYYMNYGDFYGGVVEEFRHGRKAGSNYLMLDMHVSTQIIDHTASPAAMDPWDFGNGTAKNVPAGGTGG